METTMSDRKMTLPTDSQERKNYPLLRGCLRYFPAALAGIANVSQIGNDKHNPGQEMHHARGKSWDHGDCIVRHLLDAQDMLAAYERGDSTVTQKDIMLEINQMAWRALAYAQEMHEQFGAPMAPGAKLANQELIESFDEETGTETITTIPKSERKSRYKGPIY
jgi:hypothetical protein